jgi:integrase
MASSHYQKLKPSTKEVYERLFLWLRDRYGNADFSTIKEKHVRAIRNQLKDRPSVADHMVDKIGMLWGFAKEHLGMDLGSNPAAEVAAIHTERESHKAWTPELCQKFEKLPRPRLVLAYNLMRYTGQRRSDIVRMTWNRFDGNAIEVVQEKTGTYVWIPSHPTLQARLSEVERVSPFILTSERGGPYRPTSITNMVAMRVSNSDFRATRRTACATLQARNWQKPDALCMRSCRSSVTLPRGKRLDT